MDRIDQDEQMDVSPLIVIVEYLIEIKQMNPQLSWEDLMYNCIFAGAYMAKYSKMNKDDYLKVLRGIKIVEEDIPEYQVGEA
tara:strand:- start:469 stop:714 length:246 start_codon:yes stop_codon:yes gene_type:complete